MSILVSPAKLKRIHDIIDRYHTALILHESGELSLTLEEIQVLKDAGLYSPKESVIELSYKYGNAYHRGQATEHNEMLLDDLSRISISDTQKSAVEASELRTAVMVRDLASQVKKDLALAIHIEEAAVRRADEDQLQAKAEAVASVKKGLQDKAPTWTSSWNKMSLTEKVNAAQLGTADAIREESGEEALVYKLPEPDACSHCNRLYLGSDGFPKLFKLSTLEGNGDNSGRSKLAWNPVIGVTHPNCQCQLIYAPAGYGFDEDGIMVPGGQGGLLEKSMLTHGELAIPRKRMPQISTENRNDFICFLDANDVTFSQEEILPSSLYLSQDTVDEAKVARLAGLPWDDLLEHPVIVSFDDYLLDGHHRCVAAHTKDPTQSFPILRINLPAEEALGLMLAYPNAKLSKGQLSPEFAGANSEMRHRSVYDGAAVNYYFGTPQPMRPNLNVYKDGSYAKEVLKDALEYEDKIYVIREPLDTYNINFIQDTPYQIPGELTYQELLKLTAEELEQNKHSYNRRKSQYLDDPCINTMPVEDSK